MDSKCLAAAGAVLPAKHTQCGYSAGTLLGKSNTFLASASWQQICSAVLSALYLVLHHMVDNHRAMG